jgi:hypothetical protein
MSNFITVRTSDSRIWNIEEVVSDILCADDNAVVDLAAEGPCAVSLGLDRILAKSRAKNLILQTSNALEHSWKNIRYQPPMHFVDSTRRLGNKVIGKDQDAKTFGIFIGRSNAERLLLSAVVANYSSLQTFHFDRTNDFHCHNLGLENLLYRYGKEAFEKACKFLLDAPMQLDAITSYPILLDRHLDIADYYNKFFIEIVCETYFTGQTFFCTEKIWRPIVLRTPFIVQGPKDFLKNLKLMGFKTFDRWWDEGYSEDSSDQHPAEITRIIEKVGSKTPQQLQNMYVEMTDILEHNYQKFMSLTEEDFLRVRHGQ